MNFKKKYFYVKRSFDFIFALFLFVNLLPVIFLLIFLNIIFTGFPIFFKQKRPGYKNKIFTIYKFRTMTNFKDKDNVLLSDEKRLTNFGKFLRKTSLDELPSLINVIKGEMSFVGPRPLLSKYLKRYNQNQLKRHNVIPGISGLTQVNGRNLLSWDKKFALDIYYVENYNFILDLKILFLTLFAVLKREGITPKNSPHMEEFKGNDKN